MWMTAAMLMLAGQAADPQPAEQGKAPQRIQALTVYGDDPCPEPAAPDEIIVCRRQDEGERFRIPKRFRNPPDMRTSASWARRVDMVNEVNNPRCSTVGTAGQYGCSSPLIRLWRDGQTEIRRAAEEAGEPAKEE